MSKKNICFFLIVFIVQFSILPFNNAYAKEVRSVETEGKIGFTGVYEPIGTPDPAPPENIVKSPTNEQSKPSGLLPKTNDSHSSFFKGLGLIMISMAIIIWNKKRKNQISKCESRNY